MRIISPFRDYYDGAARGDDRPLYLREPRCVEIQRRFKGHGHRGADWIHADRGLVQSLRECWDPLTQRVAGFWRIPGDPFVAGLAGKIYFGRLFEREVDFKRETFFALNSVAAEHFESWGAVADCEKEREAVRAHLRALPDSMETDDPFLALGAPIFTAQMRKNVAQITAHGKLPEMMASIVDSWTAAVNIENYLGTVLVKQEDPEPEGLTDALRAHYAGHDPDRSFRNMPREAANRS